MSLLVFDDIVNRKIGLGAEAWQSADLEGMDIRLIHILTL
jgi:hypothetical protein